ncbi:TetR/AcrR family transcriptional regulator [Nocardioides lijunqiniae]|uniref:TetR/AcrR family transcriptional regulator n=1 Tax=Nocardioides lijunqiniae TaxID=2760832 RepID=UPI001878355C|nr:TetR/AcrR family transcriptional regulator [Nocardioides lijunqiniae]
MTTPPPTRAYRSPLRAEKAAETRRAIVAAAAEVFASSGYAGATMQQVARQAGVSLESVNKVGTKAELLIKAFQQTYAGEGGWRSIIDQPELVEIMSQEDTEQAIGAYAEFIGAANDRSAGIWAAVRAAARSEERVSAAVAELIELKRSDFVLGHAWYVARGIADESVPPEAFAAYLYVLTSQETYDQLVHDWGYSPAAYVAWLRAAILAIGASTRALPPPEA